MGLKEDPGLRDDDGARTPPLKKTEFLGAPIKCVEVQLLRIQNEYYIETLS
jgi:hypothetical protein